METPPIRLTKNALDENHRRIPKRRFPSPASSVDRDYLVRNKLQRFARQGGPDLSDIRGYPLPSHWYIYRMNPNGAPPRKNRSKQKNTVNPSDIPDGSFTSPSRSQEVTVTGRKTSSYDVAFEQKLMNNGAYPDGFEYLDDETPDPPGNWDEIVARMANRRKSLSPSRFTCEDFGKFQRMNARVLGEATVTGGIFPSIRGEAMILWEASRSFGNLAPFADNLVAAQPDFYDGIQSMRLEEKIRNQLELYIIPCALLHAPILPNFFTEIKGPDASAAVAKRQALYDGVMGARGMHALQHFNSEPSYDSNAYVITATFHDGQLKIYTVHPTASRKQTRQSDYHMNQLGAWALTGSDETFRQGVGAFRNLRDWCMEKRNQFVKDANARLADMPESSRSETSSTTTEDSHAE